MKSSVRGAVFAAAIAGALVLTACGPGTGSSQAVGTWGDPGAENAAYLSLSSDGGLTGSDGCNQLTGTWKINDNDISFEDVASTRMACPDGQAVLEGLDSARVSGDTMTVYAQDDAQIATLERSSDEPVPAS